jgi:hypothetical protein
MRGFVLLGIDGARRGRWMLAHDDGRSTLVFELTRDLAPLFARAARDEVLVYWNLCPSLGFSGRKWLAM